MLADRQEKSFTVKLFVSIVFLLFCIVPGVISLAIFAPEAKQYPNAPGAKELIFLNRFSFVLLILAGLAVPLYFAFRVATFH